MDRIYLDYTNVMDFVEEKDISSNLGKLEKSISLLRNREGEGSDFLGWMDLPNTIEKSLLEDINATAEEIRHTSDAFVVVGIGGSYLGARACIEAILPVFYNHRIKTKIYFAGNSLSSRYLNHLMAILQDKEITVNVISKSGTTTETALAFRVIREWMINKYGKEEAYKRIIATTDAHKGALRELANREGIKTYTIPEDVGGRFSVLTPVGLLPIAVADINIFELLEGAKDGVKMYKDVDDIHQNPSSMYALLRNILYRKGKVVEILASFEPQLHFLAEWWKQLFGESEGKENKGIFPASVDFTTDLHSLGQWIQEGRRDIFETFIHIEDPQSNITVPEDAENLDNLNYLAGRDFTYINHQAFLGTKTAHKMGGVPNMTIEVPHISPYWMGNLFYFFEWAVAVSGYMLGVNPFNQPGVEAYKKNMFALLGKPGYEEESKKIKSLFSVQKKRSPKR